MRFSESAARALALARADAERTPFPYVASEHLTAGLLTETGGLASRVLDSLGVRLQLVSSRVDSILGSSRRVSDATPPLEPTARVATIMRLAAEDASDQGATYVGTEHLLLALLQDGKSVGAVVLTEMGASQERVQAEIVRLAARGVSADSS